MLSARNQHQKLIHILESRDSDSYTCPVCKEVLTRKFGNIKKYFAHPKGLGLGCSLKLEALQKFEGNISVGNKYKDILQEFYDKTFFDHEVELSDYQSEEGFFLTKQQKEIIFSKEDRVVVSALAGSAKSSTLYYYCKERPSKKILYVVYNKSQQLEASQSFGKLRNVEIKTVHGLAYKHVGKYYQDKLSFNYGVIDIIKDLSLEWSDMQLASQIKAFMNDYMLSEYDSFDEVSILENIEGDDRLRVINMCERLWKLKKTYKNGVKVEHDFYLKMFQLGKVDLSNDYDIICLDESQDSSMLTLSWITNACTDGVVMVGDHYQSLYKWRNSVNIMQKLKGATEYKLTTSFRVSQNIAEVSNILVQAMSGDIIDMAGFNQSQKIIDRVDRNKQYAILCRSNARILAEVIDNSDKKIFYNGGFKGYNFNNIKDAYYFSIGQVTKNPIFTRFKDYSQMVEYATDVEDIEILSLMKVIEKYGARIPKIVDELYKNSVEDANKCDIWISTIHKSKGSTIKMPMIVADDHYNLSKLDEHIEEGKDIFEEMCLIYVAITRPSGQIELSGIIKDFLVVKLTE